ncbi:LysR substrate-binding domain-containing protein [Specibacter cremeus]|uniref:LysR substrate-binding domain-containing protein n=1 Tax=Specibacter cremeus TaxID=1629051 RepID=UPI000F7847DE|nr:LysR substrate-binding domain-containing protein [Specibacter cremeus]
MTTPWPELGVLELLVAVTERGSLGAAARALGMAQPNATRLMNRLEHDLGVRLLDRRPAGSRLTAEGEVVVGHARATLEAARGLLLAARELGPEQGRHVAVAASLTVGDYLMPGWLAALRRESPDVRVALEVENSTVVFERLSRGAVDVGFVESPDVPAGFHRLDVAVDRLVVVVAPGHPWAGLGRALTPSELAAAPLVVREPGSGTRVTLDTALRGLDPVPPVLELTSNAAVRIAVASGAGAAVLSDLAVGPALAAGELVEVPVSGLDLTRRMRAVWTGGRVLHGPAGDLVNVAQSFGAPRYRLGD